MNTNVAVKNKTETLSPPTNGKQEIFYPTEEIKKVGETDFHYQQIEMLYQMLRLFFEAREDVYLSSDIMVYYEEGNPRRRFAPDLMVCFGQTNKKRRSYKLWEEKVVPSVIIEIASNATWEKDVKTKRRLYERLGVAEYYIFDPEYRYLKQPFLAYRLEYGELVRMAADDNRIYSPAIGLELVDTGEGLRLFNPETQEFLPTISEMAAELAKLKANGKKK